MHGCEKSSQETSWLFAGVVFLSVSAGSVQASDIFKSVDANGHVVYSDHLDPALSQSTAVQLDDPHAPPRELRFCWTNCFTLILEGDVYHRADGTDESWAVQTFATDAVVLHRHNAPADWNGYNQDVIYAGRVANNRLIDVTVNGKPTSGIDASWGDALNTLPANNAERDGPSGSVKTDAAPPALPEEDQPALIEDGYLWTPGYWYWRNAAYVWIAGTWVRPPQFGLLWTPAYWIPAGSVFIFHPGHWGSTVGFYGGVNYGHGYSGNGYTGGHWAGNSFVYNSGVNHVDPVVAHHTYVASVSNVGSRSSPSVAVTTRAVVKPATPSIVQRASQPSRAPAPEARAPVVVNRPAAVARTPAPGAAAKVNHVATTHAAPVRP